MATRSEKNGDEQTRAVWRSYLYGSLWSTGIVLMGFVLAFATNAFFPFNEFWVSIFQGISVIPGAATLFVGGWDLSQRAQTPTELLNQRLFKLFSSLGLLMPVWAFALVPF